MLKHNAATKANRVDSRTNRVRSAIARIESDPLRTAARGVIERLEGRMLLAAVPPGVVTPGPMPVLYAGDMTAPQTGSYKFRVAYRDPDGVLTSSIDSDDVRVTGPLGYARTAKLMWVDDSANGALRVAQYKIAAPAGNWNAIADGLYTATLRSGQVRDVLGTPAASGVIGQFRIATAAVAAAPPPHDPANLIAPNQGVLAANYGAIANDTVDDTAAIQAAINALPLNAGAPDGEHTAGGVVQLNDGIYIINSAIKLPSSVWLRGNGNATVIKNFSLNRNSASIELVSLNVHGYNVGASIRDLQIYSYYAHGIRSLVTLGDVVDLQLSNLRISTQGVAVDMRQSACYYGEFENITVHNPGSTAFWLGKATDWSGAVNRVEGLRLQGNLRAGFVGEKALVVIGGNYSTVIGGSLEELRPPVPALYVNGTAVINGLWTEVKPENLPNRTAVVFENAFATMDRINHVDFRARISLIKSQVTIGMVLMEGFSDILKDVLLVDNNSRLTIGQAYAQRDVGMLDDPRVLVQSAYNIKDGSLLTNIVPPATQNLVQDPTFSKWGTSANPWVLQWGDSLGPVTGTATVESSSFGPRLKIVVTSNPGDRPLTLFGKVNVPTNAVGRKGVGMWRIDGSAPAGVWMKDFAAPFGAGVLGSKTGVRSPLPLRASEQMIFVMARAKGTYYISQVSLTGNAA